MNAIRLIAIVLTLTLYGCRASVEDDEIHGRYLAQYDFGQEFLTIYPNGAFTQEFKIFHGPKILKNHGVWNFAHEDQMIDFHSFVIASDGYCAREPNPSISNASLPVERKFFVFGNLRIGSDEGCPYRRIG